MYSSSSASVAARYTYRKRTRTSLRMVSRRWAIMPAIAESRAPGFGRRLGGTIGSRRPEAPPPRGGQHRLDGAEPRAHDGAPDLEHVLRGAGRGGQAGEPGDALGGRGAPPGPPGGRPQRFWGGRRGRPPL